MYALFFLKYFMTEFRKLDTIDAHELDTVNKLFKCYCNAYYLFRSIEFI